MSTHSSRTIKIAMITLILLMILGMLGVIFLKPLLMKKMLPKPVLIDTANQPMQGNPQAKIHFVVFEDLKCMNCARFNREIMPHIQSTYINAGTANYTMINLAFIAGSLPAANAAHCVYAQNNALFFPFVEYIFNNQPPENENWATVPTLLNFASHIPGIDSNQLAQCIVQSPYDQFIQNNLKLAAGIMNGKISTPTLYVNGILVQPTTWDQIQKIVNTVN